MDLPRGLGRLLKHSGFSQTAAKAMVMYAVCRMCFTVNAVPMD